MSPAKSARLGVTAPRGFRAAAVSAGLKKSGREDMALVVSDTPAAAAAVFTRNQMAAAPVEISRRHLKISPDHCAVLLNAGGANACTGRPGLQDAAALCQGAAQELGCRPEQVLIASTGIIGIRLPVNRMLSALPQAAAALSRSQGPAAARAIMTTDTVPKMAEASLTLHGARVRVGGMAKGSGMIHPNLATMLVVITTDAQLARHEMPGLLQAACAGTFHAISVDGETSTNDCVFLLANGAAGVKSRPATAAARSQFLAALTEVTDALAAAIVRDGEGATKFIDIRVSGAATDSQAMLAARAVGDSQLVKTAIYGHDANWGRILSAMGATPIRLKAERIRVDINRVPLVRKGLDAGTPWARANAALKPKDILITIDLGLGSGRARYRTCDLTPRYVDINAGYRN